VLHHRTVVRFEEETEDTKYQTKEDRFLDSANAWLERFNVHKHDSFQILQGQEGFEEILRRDSVDAVYIFVPAEMQQQYVLQALKARKHVLLKDPESTPCDDFVEQMKHAVKGA
jgi:succinyl-CoA synthetase alpha subunit